MLRPHVVQLDLAAFSFLGVCILHKPEDFVVAPNAVSTPSMAALTTLFTRLPPARPSSRGTAHCCGRAASFVSLRYLIYQPADINGGTEIFCCLEVSASCVLLHTHFYSIRRLDRVLAIFCGRNGRPELFPYLLRQRTRLLVLTWRLPTWLDKRGSSHGGGRWSHLTCIR